MKSRSSSNRHGVYLRAALILAPLLVLLLGDRLIAPHYRLAYNESDSLPGTLFLVKTGVQPSCDTDAGQHVQFQMAANARWYSGARLLKVAKGCPGDRVTVKDAQVFINDWPAGEAMAALEDGTPMQAIADSVIPEGHYYLWASHPASFDSRYAEFALVSSEQVIGVAYRIF